MPTVALVIAVYNQCTQLSYVLRMVEKQSRPPDQIIIADDGSKDQIHTVLSESPLKQKIVWVRQENRGFRKNRVLNGAIRACSTDLMIFTDADCIPHKHFVADHVDLLQPETIVQGARGHVDLDWAAKVGMSELIHLYGLLRGRVRGWRASVRAPLAATRVSPDLNGGMGCNMSFWRSQLVSINGFDESYEGWGYGEDTDPSARVVLSGARRVFTTNRAVTYHIDHVETSRASAQANRLRYLSVVNAKRVRCEIGLTSEAGDTLDVETRTLV